MDRTFCFSVGQGNEVGEMATAITSHKNAAVSVRKNSEKAPVHALPCHKLKQIFQSKIILAMSPVFSLKLFSTKFESKSDSKQIFQ